jgi:hypothetical protein
MDIRLVGNPTPDRWPFCHPVREGKGGTCRYQWVGSISRMAQELGADQVIDYKKQRSREEIDDVEQSPKD